MEVSQSTICIRIFTMEKKNGRLSVDNMSESIYQEMSLIASFYISSVH